MGINEREAQNWAIGAPQLIPADPVVIAKNRYGVLLDWPLSNMLLAQRDPGVRFTVGFR
jgi:hypothetical protein